LTRATWRDVDVDGATVRVMEAGKGDPLLFLHGWGLTPRAYADGITRLTSAGVRVIAPCLPGFGASDGPGLRAVNLREYAERVGRLLDVLGVEHPVFVAGHSLGGGIAIQLATDRPERVRSLTLVNTVGGAPGRRFGLSDGSWLRWAAGTVAELSTTGLLRAAPALLRDYLPNAVRRPATMALSAHVALSASLVAEVEALVALGTPVLFIWADSDRIVAPGALADIVTSLPSEVIAGRHGWLLTEPEDFATLLRNALVVHAMLERKRRGQAVVLPKGASLSDLIPAERRSATRLPDQPPAPGRMRR
jgi:pimeloyl-ACP methyl ester carboxylesterase